MDDPCYFRNPLPSVELNEVSEGAVILGGIAWVLPFPVKETVLINFGDF